MNRLTVTLLAALGLSHSVIAYTVNVNSYGGQALQYLETSVSEPLKKIQAAIGNQTGDTLAQNTQRLRNVQENLLLVALRLSQIQALTDTGVILQEAPGADGQLVATDSFNAVAQPSNGLTFDGQSVSGEDFHYAANIVGLSGAPIGLDKALPTVVTPVSTAEQNTLAKLSAQFVNSVPPSVIVSLVRSSAIGGDADGQWALNQALNFSGATISQAVSGASAAQLLGNALPLAEGVVLRQITATDSAYNKALRGTGVDLTGFYLSAVKEGVFSPTLGFTSLPGAAPDVVNIITSGGKQAMDSYFRANGGGNTAALTSLVTAAAQPILRQLANTIPGSPLTVTPATLSASGQRLPVRLCSATTGSVGIVSGASPATALEFSGKMDANARRVSENVAQEKLEQKILAWNQRMIKHLLAARGEIAELRKSLTAGKNDGNADADPSITTLLVELDQMILSREDRAHEIMTRIERLKESRLMILQNREGIRKSYLTKAQEEAAASTVQIMETLRQSNVGAPDTVITF